MSGLIPINKYTRYIIGFLALLFLGYLVWNNLNLLVYFLISVILAVTGRPLADYLDGLNIGKKNVPSWLSALIVLVTYIALIVGVGFLITPILLDEAQLISEIDLGALIASYERETQQLQVWLQRFNIKEANPEYIEAQITQYLDLNRIGDIFSAVVNSFGSVVIGLFSVLFITFFLLKEKSIINNIIQTLSPDEHINAINRILDQTKKLLSRYFVGILAQITIIATIVSVGLSIIGVPNAIFIGVLAGMINIIPYLGPIIGGLIGIALGLGSFLSTDPEIALFPLFLKLAVVFVTAQLTDNFVLQPFIFSKSVRAHPLEIFFVILIAGNLAGIAGMILAVPVYTFLRIVGKEFFQGYKIVRGLTKDI